MHREALEREKEPDGSVWDCRLIKVMREQKDTIVNPIYEWTDTDVWEYLRGGQHPYNPMYDMGYHRVGCIGCPLATYHQKMKEFSDFPTYKEHYIKAFDEMVKARNEQGKEQRESWKDGQSVYEWWVEEWKRNVKGQITLDEYMKENDKVNYKQCKRVLCVQESGESPQASHHLWQRQESTV